jgi:hypothetical protein
MAPILLSGSTLIEQNAGFADLQSYICTHEDCRDALKTFPTRKLWADHEFNAHFILPQWSCVICSTILSTQQSFVDHLTETHGMTLTGHRLTAAVLEAKEMALTPTFKDHECPLCSQSGWQTKKSYATHVGRHLEEISLACLPLDADGSSDDGFDENDSSNPAITDALVLSDQESNEVDADSEAQLELSARSPSIEANPFPANREREEHTLEAVTEMESAFHRRLRDVRPPSPSFSNRASAGAESPPRRTSYWSVAEQRMFKTLLARFGEDFEAISDVIKTKSPIMVRSIFLLPLSTPALLDQI